MPEIIIREAKLEDAGGIAQLSDELGYPTTLEDVRLSISQIIESQQNQSFVALSLDETVIGWIHVFVTIRLTSEPFAEIGGIVVAETHQRRGIGKALLANAKKWAQTNGLTKLRVRSQTSRNDAHRFFINNGFQLSKNQTVFDKPLNP